jgi:hypothetical protein
VRENSEVVMKFTQMNELMAIPAIWVYIPTFDAKHIAYENHGNIGKSVHT